MITKIKGKGNVVFRQSWIGFWAPRVAKLVMLLSILYIGILVFRDFFIGQAIFALIFFDGIYKLLARLYMLKLELKDKCLYIHIRNYGRIPMSSVQHVEIFKRMHGDAQKYGFSIIDTDGEIACFMEVKKCKAFIKFWNEVEKLYPGKVVFAESDGVFTLMQRFFDEKLEELFKEMERGKNEADR